MKALYTPNMKQVFIAGNEYGETHYIVGENYSDAYQELLDDLANGGNICDHGGGMTDEERWREMAGEIASTCDCSLTDDGRFVWDVHVWMRELQLTVDQFLLVAEAFEGAQ